MLDVLIVNALFSIIFPLGRLALAMVPPFLTVGVRMIVAGLLFIGWHRRRHGKLLMRSFHAKDWGFLVILGVVNVYCANAYEFWGLQYMSSAKAAFIYNLGPLFSAFFSYLHFKEEMTGKKWMGLAVSMLGFVPIFMWHSPEEAGLCSFGIISSAELALVASTLATVYGWILMQYAQRSRAYDTDVANGLSMLIGGGMSLAHGIWTEAIPQLSLKMASEYTLIMLAIVSCTIASYALYTKLLRRHSATFMSFSGLTSPLFAAVIDWIGWGTPPAWNFYLATLLVGCGLYLFYQEELRTLRAS
jgi:drug/metabolite transporter (DMT)-like permease